MATTIKFKNKFRQQTVRLHGYDYGSDGAYFITICSHDRLPTFGKIKDGKIYLSIRKYITLGKFVVMPNHIHGIIFIHKSSDTPLFLPSKDIFSMLLSSGYQNAFGPQKENLASVIRGFKSAVTTTMRKKGSDKKIWQPKYHERIIRDQEEVERIENYIEENIKKWSVDRYFL